LLRNFTTVHSSGKILKETCWTLSNIAGGNSNQIRAVVNEGVVTRAVELVRSGSREVAKEATWILANLTGAPEHIKYLVDSDIFEGFAYFLYRNEDAQTVTVALRAIETILQTLKESDEEFFLQVRVRMEEIGLWKILKGFEVKLLDICSGAAAGHKRLM
jgi:hypothetical protein